MAASNALAAAVEAAVMARQGKQHGDEIAFQCPVHDDQHASASFNTSKQTWCCHAGSCGAGGGLLHLAKLLAVPIPSRNGHNPRRIVATYDYRDEAGQLLFQTVRFEPKDFQQRQPDGQGNWIYNLRGVRRVLYRLPELLAADPGETVYVTEGEKDADLLAKLHNLVATTNPMGAGKWRGEYADFLNSRRVVILADNDDAGRKHALAVAQSLNGKAALVKLLELPGLPGTGDASHWLAMGHTIDELNALVESTPPWTPATPATASEPPTTKARFKRTDIGNAGRMVALHGSGLRYCYTSRTWYVWDGRRWAEDRKGEVVRRAKATVASIYEEAARTTDDAEREELAKWALSSESAKRIRDMIAMAESEIAVTPDQFNADPWLLNCINGTVDLRTGLLLPHNRMNLITKLAPVEFRPDAHLDLWDRFLEEATGGDRELARFLQCGAGYTLTGSTGEEVLFFVHGPAAAGKSTFLESLKSTLGDYSATAEFETFIARRDVGIPRPDIARLAGARFVASIEVDEGKRLAEGLVKTLVGGDTVTARHLYQAAFEFLPAFKLWLAANHAPAVSEDDEAMWRRILRVPFEHEIPKEKRDPLVKGTLRDPELAGPAILAWAVQGCLEWQRNGLGVPPAVQKATADLRRTMDPLQDFIKECCILDGEASVEAGVLRKSYEDWARERGEKRLLMGRGWGDRLKNRGCRPGKGTGGTRIWSGIRLLAPSEEGAGVADSARVADSGTHSHNFQENPLHEGDFSEQTPLSATLAESATIREEQPDLYDGPVPEAEEMPW